MRSATERGISRTASAVPLGLEARLPDHQGIERVVNDRQVRAGYVVIEAHDDVALPHQLTVADGDFLDDAPERVLHRLDVAVHHDRPAGQDRAGQLGGDGPASGPEYQQPRGDEADHEVPVDGGRG